MIITEMRGCKMDKKIPYVYLACPIANHGKCTEAEIGKNVKNSIKAQRALMKKGYAVHNPALTWFATKFDDFSFVSHEQWVDADLSFVDRCDLVVRLAGESKGADREVQFAHKQGITVYPYGTEPEAEKFMEKIDIGEF